MWKAYSSAYGDENTFLEFLRSGSAEAFEVGCKFQLLLRYLSTKQMVPCTMETALASPYCSLELFQIFCQTLQKYDYSPHQYSLSPTGICTSNIPLTSIVHATSAACQNNNGNHKIQASKLEFLLSSEFWGSVALDCTDHDGRIPLHIALRKNLVHENLLARLSDNFNPQYLSIRDPQSGLYPFQTASLPSCYASISAVYQLLRPVPHLLDFFTSMSSNNNKRTMTTKKLCKKSENDVTEETWSNPVWISPALEQLVKDLNGELHSELIKTLRRNEDDPTWNQMIGAVTAQQCPRNLIRLLIDLHPEMLQQEDSNGRLPLHHAIICQRGDDKEMINMIVDAYPNACNHKDRHSRLPFHYACCSGKGPWLLEKLLEYNPTAVTTNDYLSDLPPPLLAAQSQRANLSSIFHLLTRSPDILMIEDEEDDTRMDET
jgi:hypothetical protein